MPAPEPSPTIPQSSRDARVVVYGAGGHGKVVAEAVLASGVRVAAFVDDGAHGTIVLGLPVHDFGWLLSLARAEPWSVVLAIGDNAARAASAKRCLDHGLTFHTAIHPSAVVSPSARVANGAVVLAQAAINAEAEIGEGAIVNTGAVVEHDVVLGPFSHVSPNATLGGAARLGAFAHLGIGATMLPGRRVGDRTVVGGGAVVVKDLPPGVVARGVPARVTRDL